MKKITAILLFLITLVINIHAGALTTDALAAADDVFAPFYNPAALSFGNASGFAFIDIYDEDGRTGNHYLVFNSDRSSFVYGKIDRGNVYQFSLSHPLFRNLYLGGDISWYNSNIGDADYGVSMLARPLNTLSLGANIREFNRSNPVYKVGIGIKPPWLAKTDKLVLTSDITYAAGASNDDYEITGHTVGMRTNPISGLYISGNYDIERETFGLNFSIAGRGLRAGTKMGFDDDNELDQGAYYVNFSNRYYPPLPFIPQRDRLYELTLKDNIVEEQEQMKLGPFAIIRDEQTMNDLVSEINKLREDDRISGIVLKNPSFRTSYANIQQLERTFFEFKEAGKSIIVYAENLGNLHYAFLASIADEIYLNPNGTVMLQGFAVHMPYLQESLQQIGIETYDLKSHEYKTGLNMLTKPGMTEYERETYESLLEVYFDTMTAMIENGRQNKINKPAGELINEGPYLNSQTALERGLVDKLIYEDELDGLLEERFNRPVVTKQMPDKKIDTVWSKEPYENIALIYAVGNILPGEGRPGRTIGSRTLSRQIRRARRDRSVKGIIIRIDSGGGSALASDIIARELKLCRQEDKPVIVSMGGAAASGGYYIAAYADAVVAEETTITGSIGVTGFLPNLKGLFEKLYVNWDSVKKGDNADLLAFYRDYEEEEIDIMREYIDVTYERFINTVGEGRDKSYDEVHRIAQGRVWSGKHALELGLTDKIGGLDTSVQMMKDITGIDNINLVDYSHTYRRIPITISDTNLIFTGKRAEFPFISGLLEKYREYLEAFADENIQYMMRPVEIEGLE